MKRTVALLLITLAALAICPAAQNPAAGKWNCVSTDENGNQVQWTLTLRDDSGKPAGEITLASGDSLPIVEPKIEKDTLTFRIRINDQETVTIELRINGDTLKGTFAGKDSGKGTVKGSRQA